MSTFAAAFDPDWYDMRVSSKEEEASAAVSEESENQTLFGHPYAVAHNDSTFFDDAEGDRDVDTAPVLLSQLTQKVFRIPNKEGVYADFSFEGRYHLPPIYDTGAKKILLCCARQVEKCVSADSEVLTAKGPRKARDIRVGDVVAALNKNGTQLTWHTVTWVSQLLEKTADEAVTVEVAGGQTLVCGVEHPLRTYRGWTKAGELKEGDWVATASTLPQVDDVLEMMKGVEAGRVIEPAVLMAIWLGVALSSWKRQAGQEIVEVSVKYGSVRGLIQEAAVLTQMRVHTHRRGPGLSPLLQITGPLTRWILKAQRGERSGVDARLLPITLKVLWGCKGSVLLTKKGGAEMRLGADSPEEARMWAALHLYAGIPCGYVNEFTLRVQGVGRERLYPLLPKELQEKVGSLVVHTDRDSLPTGLQKELRRLWNTRIPSDQDPTGLWRKTLPSHARDEVSRAKAKTMVQLLRRAPGVAAEAIDLLKAEVESSLVWRKVRSVKACGAPQLMVDLTVEGGDSFVADGFVTHNSTFLGNMLLLKSVAIPGHKALYVSPSSIQTKTFSSDRLDEPIQTSEFLRSFAESGGRQNVHELGFGNQSKITLRSAFLSADRCLTGDTPVFPVHGSPFTLSEAWDNQRAMVGRQVWATQDGKLVKSRIEAVLYQGVRDVVKVSWHGGELTMTPDQKLLTTEGWKEVQDIQVGGWIARPAAIPHGPGTGKASCELALLAYLMGDGSTVSRVSFHSSVPEVLDHVRACALSLGFGVTEHEDHRTHNVPTVDLSLSNGARDWVRGWGLWGKRSYDKRVPELLWLMDERELCVFLDALYSCDGWVSSGDSGVEVGYSTSSPWLAIEVAHLLLRLGLHATVRKRPPSTEAAKESYTVSLRDGAQVRRFLKKVPVLGRKEASKQALALLEQCRHHDTTERVPFSYAQLREHLRTRHGLSTHTAWRQHRIQLRPGNRKDSIGRGVLQTIAAKLQDPFLEAMVHGELDYVEITRIEEVGTQPTYDLSVEGSENYLSLVLVHNCRGIPAYMLALDEFQDILPEHIPVILPCISHAPTRLRSQIFTGTPKSFDNNMEFYRSGFNAQRPMSTMGEWMVPCDHCGSKTTGRTWQCLGEQNIQKKGLSCVKCGELLRAQHEDALWVHQQADGVYESYRVPQLMVPWRDWDELYADYINYPKAKFYNEVLGLSMDDHSRPLSMSEVRACCDSRLRIEHAARFLPNNWGEPIFAGIDWGMGTSSYTIMSLATYIGGVYSVFWIKRFTGSLLDVEEQIQYVLQTLRQYQVMIAGTDFGFGLQYNDTLIRRYGQDKVAVFQHLGRVTKKVWYDTKVNRFKVFRSMVMADFINMVKRKNIRFPAWEDFREPFAQDFCNITSELSETQQMVIYTHRMDRPDDSFHSCLYGFLASCIKFPRPDILKPLHDRYRQEPMLKGAYPTL